jgi:hypothetical protein
MKIYENTAGESINLKKEDRRLNIVTQIEYGNSWMVVLIESDSNDDFLIKRRVFSRKKAGSLNSRKHAFF